MKKVLIVQRRLTHYRVPLFQLLRKILLESQTELNLLYGCGTKEENNKNDSAELSWATKIPTYYFFGNRLCWQPIFHHLRGSDVVIIPQENALIANQLLLFTPHRFKLAFWGHGANFQSENPTSLKEQFKRWTINKVDHWFAYTKLSARLIESAGFKTDRITILNNAVDTTELHRHLNNITRIETDAMHSTLGFMNGPVGVFIGSLYAEKRLDFLFSAAERIRLQIPNFNLLLIGDGPHRQRVRSWCDKHNWACWAGTKFGREKALYLSIAKVMLNPGLIGLGIIDSFVSGVPILTTNYRKHSPEISYLENGYNGIMTNNSLDSYVKAAVELMGDPKLFNKLLTGCAESAKKYTLNLMARRFADGIYSILNFNNTN